MNETDRRGEPGLGHPLSVLWLAAGVVLTTASQLRPGGVPVGLGELLLLAWSVCALAMVVWSGRFSVPAPLRPFAFFWFFGFLLLCLGWTLASLRGLASKHGVYDFIAFFFVGVITLAVIVRPRADERVSASLGLVLAGTVLPLTGFLVLVVMGVSKLGPLTLWTGRFMAWSMNPNQVSLAIAPVPFFLLYKMETARTRTRKGVFGVLLLCSLLVGAATLSDALMLGWALSLVVIAALRWVRAFTRHSLPFWTAAVVYLFIPLALAAMVVRYGYPAYLSSIEQVETMYGAGNQGSVRVALWANGLLALEASPLVGHGPGAFSGIYDPFTGAEAHNSYIDWSASTGLLGITAYLALLLGVAWRAWRSGYTTLLAAVVSLAVFSTFHFVLRQPVFWFYLMFVAVESHRAGAARAAPPAAPLRAAPAGA